VKGQKPGGRLAVFVFFDYHDHMSAAALDHTVLPPPPTSESVKGALAQIAATDGHNLTLTFSDGTDVVMPAELVEVLRDAASAMLSGHAVTVAPHNTALTTQQAAELLGISRPTLVRLLEAGEVPYTQPGRHRRVALADLIHYQEGLRSARRTILATMSAEAAHDDPYAAGDGLGDSR
jgi:excisionase family DNA binding protein